MTKPCPPKRPLAAKNAAVKSLKAARGRRASHAPLTGQFLNRVILDAPVKLSARERAEIKAIVGLMRV